MFKQEKKICFLSTIKRYAFSTFLVLWMIIWLLSTVGMIRQNGKYYQFAWHASTNTLQAFHSRYDEYSKDFYGIIKTCDRLLPKDAKLQLILPHDKGRKFEFLRDKGRYILYPRNYGDNTILQKYILVYQIKDFPIPKDYKIIRSFGPDRYLLAKTDGQVK